MVWLRDIAVMVERKPDARTARVEVQRNDADEAGECAPVEGASVRVLQHREGGEPREIAHGRTDANGLYGFATPSDVDSADLSVAVHADGHNPRHLRVDGAPLGVDLRAALYGD